MITFKQFINEEVISPSKEPNTISLWHGGNLDDAYDDTISHKKGRFEFGAGLYCTTHYYTAQKYSKGSRKLYLITIKKGRDARTTEIDYNKSIDFVNDYVIKSKRTEILQALSKYKDKPLFAFIFNNIIINYEGIKPSNTISLRNFLVNQGVDYLIVDNAFGWHETMIVIFDMKMIVNKQIVKPKDKIEVFDLPTGFN